MGTTSYPYRQKLWAGPVAVIFFGLVAYILKNMAQGNQRGLIINHIIELSPQYATYFYWLLCLASLIFVLLGLLAFVFSVKAPRYITLSANTLTAPQNAFSSKLVEIPYSHISSLQLKKVQGQRFLQIRHAAGKLSLSQSLLPSEAAFDEICLLLTARVHG